MHSGRHTIFNRMVREVATAMDAPRVSVLMTTFNGASSIGAALDSILAQSFRQYELVVIDDGSVDATPAIVDRYAARDSRIRPLRTERNLGVVGARNFGFAACRGEYVAALDHDDLSHPDRLAAQLAFLDAQPRVVLVGTEVTLVEHGRSRVTDNRSVATPLLMRWRLHIDNPLTWSSVMLRTAAVRRLGCFMRPDFEYADDYDLYHRLLAVGDIARLDSVLTTYRWHDTNTTSSQGGLVSSNAARVLATSYQSWFGIEAEEAAALVIRHLSDRQPAHDTLTLDRLGGTLERVLAGFCATYPMTQRERVAVEADAAATWWQLVRSAVRDGLPRAARLRRTRPALCRGAALEPTDLFASLAVGALRRQRVTRTLTKRQGRRF